MLIRVFPNQIADEWPAIRKAIENSLPPLSSGAEERMDNILASLLGGYLHCWYSYDTKTDKLDGIVTTTITSDEVSGITHLLIFSVLGFNISRRSWLEGLRTLIKFARGKGCKDVVAYSNMDSVINFVKALGGKTDFKYLEIPLE